MQAKNTEDYARRNGNFNKPVHERTAEEMLNDVYISVAEFVEASQGGLRTQRDMASLINGLYADLDCWQNAQAWEGEATYG